MPAATLATNVSIQRGKHASDFSVLVHNDDCYGAGLEGDPCTATIYDLLCVPFCVLIIVSSTTALRQLPAETSSSEAGENWLEMAVEFVLRSISFRLVGSFNMP
jgi:hypothetical protein